MKQKDWNGQKKSVKVDCIGNFAKKALSASFKINVATEQEARNRSNEILAAQHAPFLKRTQGRFKMRFSQLTA